MPANALFMKFICLFVFVLGWMSACKSPKKESDTPRALMDKQVDVSEYTKRVHYDLLDNLYDELEEKNPALKALAAEAEMLEKQKIDSTRNYLQFVSKNMAYYSAGIRQAGNMKDSVLRKTILALMDSSRTAFNSQINGHQNFLKYLDSSKTMLSDHLLLLKLVKTLEVMEEYQRNQMPDSTGLLMLIQKYAAMEAKTDSLRTLKP